MRRSSTLRGGVAALALMSAAIAAVPAVSAPGGLQVRVGQAERFSRVEFAGLGSPKTSRQGQVVTLTFGRDVDPDMSVLGLAPPRWLKSADAEHDKGHLRMVLTLADDADAKSGTADGAFYVNVFPKGAAAPAPGAAVTPVQAPAKAEATAAPSASASVLKVSAQSAAGQTQLNFAWPNPAAAAVFRRGDSVWIVFDQPARLDISALPAKTAQYAGIQTLGGPTWSALRLNAPGGGPVSASAQNNSWTISLGGAPAAMPTAVIVSRDRGEGVAGLTAQMAGARAPISLKDPEVGDTLVVVPALGPVKANLVRRDYPELSLLPTTQGLAVEPHAPNLSVIAAGDLVNLARPGGLALSSSAVAAQAATTQSGPRPADLPGLFDADWTAPRGEFLPRYQALMIAAANEGVADPNGPADAHLALARFLIGNDLGYEAIGVLDRTIKGHPSLSASGEFMGLRGMAKAMVGRTAEAELDLASPLLVSDPAAAEWRAYVAATDRRFDDARKLFQSGDAAESRFPDAWRSRFARAEAETALNGNDAATATSAISRALSLNSPPEEQLRVRLLQARLMQQTGDPRALPVFEAVARAPDDSVAAPALMYATGMKLAAGKITPAEAASAYDALRYRWRGDATELQVVRALGQLYIGQGQYRQALETYVTAKDITPDDPVAVQIQNDASNAFRALFLNGGADGMQPIQALGLFKDYQELTPLGPDGDLMLRMMAARLASVDLLPQAASYLQYQIDNRLDGASKAQVATTLATIYLMNRQPEDALNAINASRTTLLPMDMNLQRRRLSARALIALGRTDDALEMLTGDNSAEAQSLRADVAWKAGDWAKAGPLFEKRLGDRWKTATTPLDIEDEGDLLRAGVAYTLASDNASIARLRGRYQGFFAKAANPDALKVIYTDADPSGMSLKDFARVAADDAEFQGWVQQMKQQLRNPPGKPAAQQQASAGPAASNKT